MSENWHSQNQLNYLQWQEISDRGVTAVVVVVVVAVVVASVARWPVVAGAVMAMVATSSPGEECTGGIFSRNRDDLMGWQYDVPYFKLCVILLQTLGYSRSILTSAPKDTASLKVRRGKTCEDQPLGWPLHQHLS